MTAPQSPPLHCLMPSPCSTNRTKFFRGWVCNGSSTFVVILSVVLDLSLPNPNPPLVPVPLLSALHPHLLLSGYAAVATELPIWFSDFSEHALSAFSIL